MNTCKLHQAHLDEETLYLCLDFGQAGKELDPTDDHVRHLLVCPSCQSELQFLRSSIAGLCAATTLLVAQTTNERSLHLRLPARLQLGWTPLMAAAALLCAILLSPLPFRRPLVSTTSSINVPIASRSLPESDEALLDEVNQDLSTSLPPSLEPLAVRSVSDELTASKSN